MDFEGRKRPQPLEHRVLLQADQSLPLHAFIQEVFFFEWQLFPRGELRFGRAFHGGIKAGDVDLAVRAFEPRQEACQLFVGVGCGAAVLTRVEIGLGSADCYFRVAETTQRRVDGWPARRDVRHVRNDHGIGANALRLALDQIEQNFGAVLLLTLDQEPEVDRGVGGIDRLQQAEDLPLVVGRAAGVELAVALCRLERWSRPLGERVRRLHVVVSVDQQRRRTGNVGTFGPNDRMCVAAKKRDVVTAETPQLGADPLCGGTAILVVCGQCRDGRNPQKLVQLAQQSFLIHGGRNVDTPVAASQRVGPG